MKPPPAGKIELRLGDRAACGNHAPFSIIDISGPHDRQRCCDSFGRLIDTAIDSGIRERISCI